MLAFWVVRPCVGGTFLRSTGICLQVDTALQPRRPISVPQEHISYEYGGTIIYVAWKTYRIGTVSLIKFQARQPD
jgi:hypothetical protein